jgi:hypothetical protein
MLRAFLNAFRDQPIISMRRVRLRTATISARFFACRVIRSRL